MHFLWSLAYIDPTQGLPPNVWWAMIAAAAGTISSWLGLFAIRKRIGKFVTRHAVLSVVIGIIILAGSAMAIKWWWGSSDSSQSTDSGGSTRPRVLILGFDGMDPRLLDQYMAEGKMRNLSRLAHDGIYHPLATTLPPQSPVAWCTFITGDPPAKHGVADFINRDPSNYMPDLSTADRQHMTLPWKGTPFWEKPTIAREGFVGLRLPMVFPPPKLNGRLLAGMGVWDIRGTEGTAFYYSNPKLPDNPDGQTKLYALIPDGDVLKGAIPGPVYVGGTDSVLENFELRPGSDSVTLTIRGKDYPIPKDRWSDWIPLEFRMGPLGLQRMKGITRVLFKYKNGAPTLYVAPINFDPSAPAYPISYPRDYSAELVKAIGPFCTRGMPFDTHPVQEGVLSDDDFLDQIHQVTDESSKMLSFELKRFKSGVLFAYFEASDMTQHMFWRGIDPKSAMYNDPETLKNKDAIPDMYKQFDEIAGDAQQALGEGGTLVIISDHGFAPFRKCVNLNSELRALGFLTLKAGHTTSDRFFDAVDWTQTRAYALGFNSIYINLKGRERDGIVDPQDADSLMLSIEQGLENWHDSATGEHPIIKVHPVGRPAGASMNDRLPDLIVGYKRGYRASWVTPLGAVPEKTIEPNVDKWSGDHLIDPSEVPGIFLSSDRTLNAKSLGDVGSAVEAYLAAKLNGVSARSK